MSMLLAMVFAAPSLAGAAVAPAPSGKILLVALSGPEDVAKLLGPYRHAVIMKKTGRLKDIAIVVYGRAVAALSTKAKGIPEPVRDAIREAHAAGVPIYVCENALANAGIEDVIPEAQRVPLGAAKIAELVSEGFVPMQY